METLRIARHPPFTARTLVEVYKPVTWFPPMWAFLCGVVSAGGSPSLGLAALGLLVAGPLVCGASQAINDWYDRHVDAINEPSRPIPSGRLPGRWGLIVAIAGTVVAALAALPLGPWGTAATVAALAMAWGYSAPPVRFKSNGWIGNGAVALCYEGLAWITGAAVVLGGQAPNASILLLAFLYSAGAHGIMTLNDFKSIDGDLRMGIGSLPARLGAARAARVTRVTMLVPQVVVILVLASWGRPDLALIVTALALGQLWMLNRLVSDPTAPRALWVSAFGVPLFVSGMMVSAFALRGLA